MYYVYILKSKIKNWYYTGQTEDLQKRLEYHNAGRVKSTKPYKPYEIVYTESFETREDAYRREHKIKRLKKGESFKKLVGSK